MPLVVVGREASSSSLSFFFPSLPVGPRFFVAKVAISGQSLSSARRVDEPDWACEPALGAVVEVLISPGPEDIGPGTFSAEGLTSDLFMIFLPAADDVAGAVTEAPGTDAERFPCPSSDFLTPAFLPLMLADSGGDVASVKELKTVLLALPALPPAFNGFAVLDFIFSFRNCQILTAGADGVDCGGI